MGDDVISPDSRIRADAGRQYWQGIGADDDGMLGGYSRISRVDLRGSRSFLARLGLGRRKKGGTDQNGEGGKVVRRALEGGAGIGRITQGLLLDISETVDVVEPIAKFTERLRDREGVGRVFNVGLEEWRPVVTEKEEGGGGGDIRYDLIWNQWCVGHLTDRQLEQYLVRCKSVLSRDEGDGAGVRGIIVVKENLATGTEDLFDEVDSSVTRLEETFRRIFENAGLRIVKTELQYGFPAELYPVRTFALKPKEESK